MWDFEFCCIFLLQQLRWSCGFFSFHFVNMVYYLDQLFFVLNHPFNLRINPTWSCCVILLICYWLLFTSIMFRIFESVFTGDFGLQFSYSAFEIVGSKAILIIFAQFCGIYFIHALFNNQKISRCFNWRFTTALFLHGSLLPGIHPYFFLPPYLPVIYYIFSTQPGLCFFLCPSNCNQILPPRSLDDLELASLILLYLFLQFKKSIS